MHSSPGVGCSSILLPATSQFRGFAPRWSWRVLPYCLHGSGLSAVSLKQHPLSCTLQACGGSIQTSVNALTDDVLGQCELFEEVQIGGER